MNITCRKFSYPVWLAFLAVLAFSALPAKAQLDALDVQLSKGQAYVQTTSGIPTPATNSPFLFQAVLVPTFASFVSEVSIQTPALATDPMPLNLETNFAFSGNANSQGTLDATYGAGTYTFNYTGTHDGQAAAALSLGADDFPPIPVVSNILSAQTINASNKFTVIFSPDSDTNDYVQLIILDTNANPVFETGPIYLSEGLIATNSAITIPSNTFAAASTYAATLQFARYTTVQMFTLPYTQAGFFSQTSFQIQTLSALSTNGTGPGTNGPPPQTNAAIAPSGFIGSDLTFAITNGSGVFASAGGYQLFTSALGSNYAIVGPVGQGLASGTYSYAATGTNSATLTLLDSQLGSGLALNVSFAGPGTGSYIITSASSGSQSGIFSGATNYLTVSAADIYFPIVSNHFFEASFSGQAGGSYSLQTSTDLAHWSVLTNFYLAGSTTNISDTSAAGAGRFYRTHLNSITLAPASLLGFTFNISVTGGATPLTNKAIFQFMTASNTANYQIMAGPGATNGAGSYTYTVTGPQTATLSYVDTGTGVNSQVRLFFTSAETGSFFLSQSGSSGFQSGSFTLTQGVVLLLGNVKFTPDLARSGSGLFPADGITPLSLNVTDAAGYVWNLTIPVDALQSPATISMAPFANIDSSGSLLQVASGVQLSPDGTQFLDGVRLTVTAPSNPLGPHATLAMADANGGNLYYVTTTNQSKTYSTTIYHFSSGAVGNAPPPPGGVLGSALQSALDAVQQLSSQAGNSVPPLPPDAGFACDDQNNAAAAQWAAKLFAPEQKAIQTLLSADQAYVSAIGYDPYASQVQSAIRNLVEASCFTKVDLLFTESDQVAVFYFPVLDATIDAGNLDAQYGGAGSQWNAELAAWVAGPVVNYYLQKLQNSDYTAVSAIGPIKNELSLYNLDASSVIQKFSDALTFQVTLNINDSGGTLTLGAEGMITISGGSSDVFPLTGFDVMNYTAGTLTQHGCGPDTLQLPLTWSQGVEVASIDGCSQPTVNVLCSPFGADYGGNAGVPETWLPADGPPNYTAYFMLDECNTAFQKKYPPGQTTDPNILYSFPCMLANGSPSNGQDDFTGAGNFPGGTVSVTITLMHTPR